MEDMKYRAQFVSVLFGKHVYCLIRVLRVQFKAGHP